MVIFIPKIPIWVNLGGSCMEDVGIYFWHFSIFYPFGIFYGILEYFMAFWNILWHFGIFYGILE
jgi:hypothetical protein